MFGEVCCAQSRMMQAGGGTAPALGDDLTDNLHSSLLLQLFPPETLILNWIYNSNPGRYNKETKFLDHINILYFSLLFWAKTGLM